MDALRRLAFRFAAHKAMSPQEFALLLIAELAVRGENERDMLAVAELLLNARPSGEG